MKDFPHASFPPDTIALMTTAMDSARSRLPHPVTSAHIKSIAETILRSTQEGERDPAALERLALLELTISPRDFEPFSRVYAVLARYSSAMSAARMFCRSAHRAGGAICAAQMLIDCLKKESRC